MSRLAIFLPSAALLCHCTTLGTSPADNQIASKIDISSGFEGSDIDTMWKTSKLAPGSWVLQRNHKRAGSQAVQISLRQGDIEGIGEDGHATERAELKEKDKYHASFHQKQWYCFSFMLPKRFPETNKRLVIGQWKQTGDRNPVVAQRIVNHQFAITISSEDGKKALYLMPKSHFEKLKGQWIDMTYEMTFSHQSGSLKSWMNGKQVVSYQGPLGYEEDPKSVYFKFGLYRDSSPEPMTIFFDNYSHSNLVRPKKCAHATDK